MDNTIIVALIASIPSVIATIVSNSKAQALMEFKIKQLDEKVEKHNNLVERTYQLEEDVKVLKTKMDMYHHN